MELKQTEKIGLICNSIAVDSFSDSWYIAMGLTGDVNVCKFDGDLSLKFSLRYCSGFSLNHAVQSLCHDEREFNVVSLRKRHLLFAVDDKLYIWNWVNWAPLYILTCPDKILYLQVSAESVIFSGYKDVQCYWTATGTLTESGVFEHGSNVKVFDRPQPRLRVDCSSINQRLHMDMIMHENEALQNAVLQFDVQELTAFRYNGEHAYFAGIAKNGKSFIARVEFDQGITLFQIVSTARYVSSMAVYNNMLCSIDITERDTPCSYYFCNYDAKTLLPIHQQRIRFENNAMVDMAISNNYLLVCGGSSDLLHVFEPKQWDNDAVLTFLLCLRRKGFLPELTLEFIIPFMFAIKFDRPA